MKEVISPNIDYRFKTSDLPTLKKLGLVIDSNYESHEDATEAIIKNTENGSTRAIIVSPTVMFLTENRVRTVLMPSRQILAELTGKD